MGLIDCPRILVAGVLEGLRVVELSAFVAAPLSAATLAGLGADVIRVEQLGGGVDAARWPVHDGRSLYREGLDRGKRSFAIDLRSPQGQQLAVDLICGGGPDGGILITNLPPRGWMAFDRLSAGRPDLIMVVIQGTSDGDVAVDYTVNAAIGFPMVTGSTDDHSPVNHVFPAWDVATASLAATAILAAERRRRLTGMGALVEIALTDVAVEATSRLGYIAEAELVNEPRGRFGNYLYGSYGRDFLTSDLKYVMVCALTPRQWRCLVAATGIALEVANLEVRRQANLKDEGDRFRLREEISALIGPWVAARPMSDVASAFDSHNVLWAPYRTFKEVVAQSPNVLAPPPSPIRFVNGPEAGLLEPRAIGADTRAILSDELGLDSSVLGDLKSNGVID
jgi:2-methylfumaryl-CoA isomerase